MRHNYSFSEVIEHTGVDRNRLMRWADAEIIRTGGGGSQGKRREFSFRNLIEVAVCDQLRGLGVSEPRLRAVVTDLNTIWDQSDEPINWRRPTGAKYRDATILWLAFQRVTNRGTDFEVVATYPVMEQDLIARLTTGPEADGSGIPQSGIAIPIARIIEDLEQVTGDIFDVTSSMRKKVEKALAKKDPRHE